ncbi:MAG: hypothetical protein DRI94_07245, partial [Bacteroidetes bacterium]
MQKQMNNKIMNDTTTICNPQIKSTHEEFETEFITVKNSNTQKDTDNKKIKLLSLFSGCGGLDLGLLGGFNFKNRKFDKNNFEIVFSNDFDKAATKVYDANYNYFKHNITEKDIAEIKHDEVPDFDFLVGGFPCQPFSNAGLRKGISDSRGTLFENAIEMFKISIEKGRKPIGFMFENVRGI